jgi:hypothetical protein
MDREVLQILPSPPGFLVARYEHESLVISPVVMWALVKYKGRDEEFERVEPVSFDIDLGMRVGNTEGDVGDGPSDAVLLAEHCATVSWTKCDGRVVGTIEVTENLPGGPAVRDSVWGAKRMSVDGPPPPSKAK